jgi:pimeloyl-ACP methyl ester carboxylesterase
MPHLEITPEESLFYEYDAPGATGQTFVFVNALTGNTGMWQADAIGPKLRAAGYGTLCYNFRGQTESKTSVESKPTPTQIVEDLGRVVAHVNPPRPILVGLSIGGLFAAQAYHAGAPAEGIVLINTLRKPSDRLNWINTAMADGVAAGGFRLIMSLSLPMLVNPEKLAEMRAGVITGAPFEPIEPNDGGYRLMVESVATDWDFPWDSLDVPVLVQVGLHDRVFLVHEDVDELMTRIPNVRREDFTDAGHLIPAERPEAFTESLMDFARTL